jgi:hypothetical protein
MSRFAIHAPAVLLALVGALSACSRQPEASAPRAAPKGEAEANANLALAIMGYNYTDRYIDSFTVNGQGGGNLFLSTPTEAGGKSTCCVNWWPGTALPTQVRVRWVGAYCKERRTNSDGETRDWTRGLWKEATAELRGPIPADPRFIEVHIYPNDTVEVAITQRTSPPRLQRPVDGDGRRPGIAINDPMCTREQLQQQ